MPLSGEAKKGYQKGYMRGWMRKQRLSPYRSMIEMTELTFFVPSQGIIEVQACPKHGAEMMMAMWEKDFQKAGGAEVIRVWCDLCEIEEIEARLKEERELSRSKREGCLWPT